MLLWLWHRSAATAPIGSLAWELPCAVGVALKRQKDQKKKKERKGTPGKKIMKAETYIAFHSSLLLGQSLSIQGELFPNLESHVE